MQVGLTVICVARLSYSEFSRVMNPIQFVKTLLSQCLVFNSCSNLFVMICEMNG